MGGINGDLTSGLRVSEDRGGIPNTPNRCDHRASHSLGLDIPVYTGRDQLEGLPLAFRFNDAKWARPEAAARGRGGGRGRGRTTEARRQGEAGPRERGGPGLSPGR